MTYITYSYTFNPNHTYIHMHVCTYRQKYVIEWILLFHWHGLTFPDTITLQLCTLGSLSHDPMTLVVSLIEFYYILPYKLRTVEVGYNELQLELWIGRKIIAAYKVQYTECVGQAAVFMVYDPDSWLTWTHDCVLNGLEAPTYLCYRWQPLWSGSVWQQLSCCVEHLQVRQALASYAYKYTLHYHTTRLHWILAGAQEVIRNFQVANRNSTHITFSWDIVDGYYTSSYINRFRIYYVQRPSGGYYSYHTIYYSNSNLIKIGASFQYTATATSFSYYGQYVMWVYVRRSSLTPSTVYSDQIYVEVGKWIMLASNCWHEALTHLKLWGSLLHQNNSNWGILLSQSHSVIIRNKG